MRSRNIDEGASSAAFHSYPQNLGTPTPATTVELLGHAVDGTHVINHPSSWQALGGNVREADGWVTVQTLIRCGDVRRLVCADARCGTFERVDQSDTKAVTVKLSPAAPFTPALLRIEQPARIAQVSTSARTHAAAIRTRRIRRDASNVATMFSARRPVG